MTANRRSACWTTGGACLRRAWSIRFAAGCCLHGGWKWAVPGCSWDVMPRSAFVLLGLCRQHHATVARIVAQPEMHR